MLQFRLAIACMVGDLSAQPQLDWMLVWKREIFSFDGLLPLPVADTAATASEMSYLMAGLGEPLLRETRAAASRTPSVCLIPGLCLFHHTVVSQATRSTEQGVQ